MNTQPKDEAGRADGRERMSARLTLFGSPSREATLEVTPRTRRERTTRALAQGGAGLLAAPLAGLIPPHFPWALAALGIGAWRARTEWRGELRLHAFEGACPRCGKPLELKDRYVTLPLAVTCYACHAQSLLTI